MALSVPDALSSAPPEQKDNAAEYSLLSVPLSCGAVGAAPHEFRLLPRGRRVDLACPRSLEGLDRWMNRRKPLLASQEPETSKRSDNQQFVHIDSLISAILYWMSQRVGFDALRFLLRRLRSTRRPSGASVRPNLACGSWRFARGLQQSILSHGKGTADRLTSGA